MKVVSPTPRLSGQDRKTRLSAIMTPVKERANRCRTVIFMATVSPWYSHGILSLISWNVWVIYNLWIIDDN